MGNRLPFHPAFPVANLGATRDFFTENLGCRVRQENDRWIDFDFFGHQVTAHPSDAIAPLVANEVDGKPEPLSHVGLMLGRQQWHVLAERLRQQDVTFRIAACLRFRGQVGEQATLFTQGPSRNAIDFQCFREPSRLLQRWRRVDTRRALTGLESGD